MRQYKINNNDAGQRVDRFIAKMVPSLPPALLQKYIRTKRIKLNGKRCDNKTFLLQDDLLELYINDEFFDQFEKPLLASIKGEVEVVYEDENILLVNKPAGLVVHEDESGSANTLINRIQVYLHKKGEYTPDMEHSFAPALCNRIDRNTSGIVISAKNAATLRVMNQMIKEHQIDKVYRCAIHGKINPASGVLTAYHQKDEVSKIARISKHDRPGYKTMITAYQTIQSNDRYTMLDVQLITGRTHQIRAHFAFEGHPLVGDTKYGTALMNKGTGYRYQALCSYSLTFKDSAMLEHLSYLAGKTFSLPKEPNFSPLFDK